MTEQIDSCIKFSQKSWHFKMISYLYGTWYFFNYNYNWREPERKLIQKRISLCKYFWTVVTGVFIFPFIVIWRSLPNSIKDHEDIAKAISVWIIICSIVQIVAWILDPNYWWLGFTVFFSGLGIGAAVAGFIIGLSNLWDKYQEKRYEKLRHHKPSLVKEFIKAKKNKICPCIEFVDEVKE